MHINSMKGEGEKEGADKADYIDTTELNISGPNWSRTRVDGIDGRLEQHHARPVSKPCGSPAPPANNPPRNSSWLVQRSTVSDQSHGRSSLVMRGGMPAYFPARRRLSTSASGQHVTRAGVHNGWQRRSGMGSWQWQSGWQMKRSYPWRENWRGDEHG